MLGVILFKKKLCLIHSIMDSNTTNISPTTPPYSPSTPPSTPPLTPASEPPATPYNTFLPPISDILNLPPSIITEINEANGQVQLTPPVVNNYTFGNIPNSQTQPFIFNGTNITNTSDNNVSSNPFNFHFPSPIQLPMPNLDSFSPEEIEEELNDTDDTEDTEDSEDLTNNTNTWHGVNNTARLFRLRQFKNLPYKHFSMGVIWSFENNYDYYRIDKIRYFSECRSTRYLTFKNDITNLNKYKHIKIGKYWQIKYPEEHIKVKYIYFIIYFNNTLGYIDIDYYGLFSEEINETKTIQSLIDLGIYGSTGRLHKANMTCTDGVGFNLCKHIISNY
jgi:hypothetical protein